LIKVLPLFGKPAIAISALTGSFGPMPDLTIL
jgi:hypothetical protein